ncbi:hypothetical protein [Comamonas composti]|uniref:hypothetical protein n=1 Tax=Comamonas composti TaxID=408558 RepID=UPI0012EB5B0A|nr:hypothetical protein [Comamonas composti]
MSASPEKDDGYKLSHLALNQMYAAARKSSEFHPSPPWLDLNSKEADINNLHQRFALEQLQLIQKSVQIYFEKSQLLTSMSVMDALRTHGPLYLAWRYHAKFENLDSVKYAVALNDKSLANYRKGEIVLRENIKDLEPNNHTENSLARNGFHSQAKDIFDSIKVKYLDEALGKFFDSWVHDSYAGFIEKFEDIPAADYIHSIAEAQGYFRWRGLYTGSDEKRNGGPLAINEGLSGYSNG